MQTNFLRTGSSIILVSPIVLDRHVVQWHRVFSSAQESQASGTPADNEKFGTIKNKDEIF